MKTRMRFNMYLPMAAMILTAALAVSSEAQKQVPFKGVMQAQDHDDSFTDTTVVVTTTGTGEATHLGQFSFTLQNTVDFVAGTSTGFAHFIAANGDTFDATVLGFGGPTADPDVISITETYTITGGTGRFAGAEGTFTMQRSANVVTFFTSGSFDGTITSPGAAH